MVLPYFLIVTSSCVGLHLFVTQHIDAVNVGLKQHQPNLRCFTDFLTISIYALDAILSMLMKHLAQFVLRVFVTTQISQVWIMDYLITILKSSFYSSRQFL